MIYNVAQKQDPEVQFINIPLVLIFFSKTLCCLLYNIYINIQTKIDLKCNITIAHEEYNMHFPVNYLLVLLRFLISNPLTKIK